MSAKTKLVIVESPTKAKTIRKFLPKEFVVEASMGHVRDLPQSAADIPAAVKQEPWAKIGVNVDRDFEPLYVVPKGKAKVIRDLRDKLKKADELYLATDEDREGESISWHLLQLLKPKVPVKRMVFHEITKTAIMKALKDTRKIDDRLVHAQEARRILDRLVGYTLSPLIWKKIAYGLSAGRVQSAGLRLIVERERERLRFVKAEYWDLGADLEKDGTGFQAKLHSVDEVRIASGKDFDETTGKLAQGKNVRILDEKAAIALIERLKGKSFVVKSVDEKETSSRPAPPFITSTLQQEANRKLGLSAQQAMRTAQRLYEEGLITYMRTDSPNLSQQAIEGARSAVQELYGKEYLSPEPRQYSAKQKGAQEAHEAIRPAGEEFVHPKDTGLDGKELALYELIWKRTVATQMAEARKLSVTARIEADGAVFSASGTRILFPGFIRAYVEGSDDPEAALGDKEVLLPDMKEGDSLKCLKVQPFSHETKPPARYTEASLVQALEREGVGRPSTYASIISTIQDRGYVKKLGNALVPTFTGIAVSQLLEKHFDELVDLGFTSGMEKTLDEIAAGEKEWVPYLREFYLGKNGPRAQVEQKEKKISPEESRTVNVSPLPDVQIKVGRYGAYVIKKRKGSKDEVHVSIPEDIAPADLTDEILEELIAVQEKGPQPIGKHPETGQNLYVLMGRYGPYCQLGEVVEGSDEKPKRASIPKGLDYKNLPLDEAVKLLSLPRLLGHHPETGKEIRANQGRFGPYVVHDGDFRSLKKDDNLFTVDLKRALELLSAPKMGRGGSQLVKDLGAHPDDGKQVGVYDGKYGLYVKHGSKNASIPKDLKAEDVTLEKAIAWINERNGKGGKAPKGGSKKKAAAQGADPDDVAGNETVAPKKKAAIRGKSASKTA